LNRLQLSHNGSTYEAGKDVGDYRITAFPMGDQALEAKKPAEVRATRPSVEMDTRPLYRLAYRNPALDRTAKLDARTEFNQRLALPFACLLMALVGIPLGITRRRAEVRRGGDDAGLAFLYYIGLIGFIGMARQARCRPKRGRAGFPTWSSPSAG
jgi:lipopolysaccharide export LptBFGC system permease protein LptF